MVCQLCLVVASSICSKHLDFLTSWPISSFYIPSKVLYWRHDGRDTYLKASFYLNARNCWDLSSRRVRSWNLSVVPPHNNSDTVKLFHFECEAILWFCPVPCDLTSAIIIVRWWEAPKADQLSKRNLSHCTSTFTHTHSEKHTHPNVHPLLLAAQSINWSALLMLWGSGWGGSC